MITNDQISRANDRTLNSYALDIGVDFTPDASLDEKRNAIRKKVGIPEGGEAPERKERMFKKLPMLQPPFPKPLLKEFEDAENPKVELKAAMRKWQAKMDAHAEIMMEPVTIRIQAARKGDPKYIIVGVNGHTWQLNRNVEMQIPMYLFKVMEESIETKYELVQSGDKYRIDGYDAPSIPYQRLK